MADPEGAGWEADVVAVSGQAADLVRDQIRALLGRARQRADEIEREAGAEAGATRGASRRAARTVLESIEGIELGLQAHIEELRKAARSDQQDAVPAELIAASETVHAQADLLRSELDSKRTETGPSQVRSLVENAPPPAGGEDEDDLAAQARRRAAVADDLTLLDMYGNAQRRAEEGDDELWVALREAVVAEAAHRESFGEDLDLGAGVKRSQRNARRRALDAISATLEGQ